MTRTTGQCEVATMTDEIKLYHGNTLIGIITDVAPEDSFLWNGTIAITAEGESYRHVFAYLEDEGFMSNEPDLPFEETYLENWFIEKEPGVLKEITIPAIYLDDKEIIWHD